MAEVSLYNFSHKEVVEALIKHQGLHEGLWQLVVEFGIQGANMGPSPDQIVPAAIIPIIRIGLKRGEEENALCLDAAKVNPKAAKQKGQDGH